MVILDEGSRNPVVCEVKTTAGDYVVPALDDAFSLLGIPSGVKTDNGPPFNGSKFREFCQHMGIKHRKIAPENPRANGCAEKFMRNLGKVIRSAASERKDWRAVLNEFLRNYRSTLHASTGVAPAELMFGRARTSRLPNFMSKKSPGGVAEEIVRARDRDRRQKEKAKRYADERRRAKNVSLAVGDVVLVRQKRKDKWTTPFGAREHKVVATNGSMVTVSDGDRTFARDRSFFKKLVGRGQVNGGTERGVELDERVLDEKWRAIRQQPRDEATAGAAECGRSIERAVEPRRSTRARRQPLRYGQEN
jgi:hypothetical protein